MTDDEIRETLQAIRSRRFSHEWYSSQIERLASLLETARRELFVARSDLSHARRRIAELEIVTRERDRLEEVSQDKVLLTVESFRDLWGVPEWIPDNDLVSDRSVRGMVEVPLWAYLEKRDREIYDAICEALK